MVEVLKLEESLTDIVEIESHLVSTRNACLYRALSREDGSVLTLWESRARIAEDKEKDFLERFNKIASLKLPNCPLRAYGIDSERRGFAIMSEIEANFIISEPSAKVDLREAERRFTPCLQIISKLHSAQIVLGDLCHYSFVLDRSGKIAFIGVMGDLPLESYREDLESEIDSLTPEIFQYVSPEQRNGEIATAACDVFALGVLGYRLFAGSYPFGKITKDKYLGKFDYPSEIPEIKVEKSKGITSVPGWCNQVFRKSMHMNPDVRYQSAADIVSEISSLRQKAIAEAELPAEHRAALEASSRFTKQTEGAQKFDSPKIEKKTQAEAKPSLTKNKFIFVIGLASLAAVIIGLLSALFVFGRAQSVPKADKNVESDSGRQPLNPVNYYSDELKLLIQGLDGESLKKAANTLLNQENDLSQINTNLQLLLKSRDLLANKVLVLTATQHPDNKIMSAAQRLIIDNYSNSGFTRSADIIKSSIADTKSPYLLQGLLSYANTQLELSERESLLRQIYPTEPETIIMLAAASALDSTKPQDYQPVLSQLIGDVLSEQAAANYSSVALMLAEPQIANLFSEELLLFKDQLQDQDLLWLIKILAKREDANLRTIAEIGLGRLKITGWKNEYLKIISQKEDLSPAVVLALTNAAIGQLSDNDVSSLAAWIDPLSNQALTAICAENQDPGLVLIAFDTLAAKPLADLNLANLLQLIRNKYWEERAQLAILVPAVYGSSEINSELNPKVIELLAKYADDSQLLKFIFKSLNTDLLSGLIERYTEKVDLTILLELLDRPERDLKIKTIRALKDYNDAISLNLIKEKYKKEKDPEIIKLYKSTFWILENSENPAQQ